MVSLESLRQAAKGVKEELRAMGGNEPKRINVFEYAGRFRGEVTCSLTDRQCPCSCQEFLYIIERPSVTVLYMCPVHGGFSGLKFK